jgi:alanyl-tRNA synthetase
MTDRLYYTDAYLTTFDAEVVGRSEDGRRVTLDRSAFYPTSGGQPHDLGLLGGVRVTDVIDDEEEVTHVLESPLTGERVHGAIDWPRRFDHMQQHTGQHLLSAVIADLYGHETVSVHFAATYSTLDLDVPTITPERIREVEVRVNAVMVENRPVRVSFEDAATATGLRKATTRAGTIRVVQIDGLDRSACGGTHVRATGEIGAILLGRVEKVRGAARMTFVCGHRAVQRARADHEALSGMAQRMSASLEELPALVASQREQLQTLESARRRLESELDGYRARERYEAAVPDLHGVRRVVERRPSGAVDELRGLGLALCGFARALMIGVVVEPPAVLLAASEDSGVDAGRTLKEALVAVGGRGGGSPRLAQGTVPDRAALDRLLDALGAGSPRSSGRTAGGP